MIQTEIQTEPLINERIEENADPLAHEADISFLDILVLVVEGKRFILRFMLVMVVLAIAAAFLLPVEYEAKITLLPPQQNSSVASSLTGQIGGALGALGALASGSLGLKNPADMYVSLLMSRTVEDGMIERFGLIREYRVKRMSGARKQLEENTKIVAGSKDGLIRITLEDHNAKRAAELANGYVDEFRKLSATLAITEAARRRLFFEQQLQQSKTNLTAAEDAMAKTQQSTGVLELDSQARALIESAAVLRAEVVAKQVQIEGMRSFAANDNPDLALAKQELAALQSQLEKLGGAKNFDPSDLNLSKGTVTQAGLEYLRRYRELKYQETIFELLAKEFEIAKLDEAREGSIVQVVDNAVVPDRRSSPHRTLIVIGTTMVAFLFAVFWLFVRDRWDRTFEMPENRERLQAMKRGWKGTPHVN
ncbi:MAG TPA: GNVR domain-containing protein [Candidatus Sulfotelmatobacter sp.]